MNNGQMDRSNENTTQYLPWWLREAMKKSQSGWLEPGFELGTLQIGVECVTTAPPHSVERFLFRRKDIYYYNHVKYLYASVLKRKISSLIWLTSIFSLVSFLKKKKTYKMGSRCVCVCVCVSVCVCVCMCVCLCTVLVPPYQFPNQLCDC